MEENLEEKIEEQEGFTIPKVNPLMSRIIIIACVLAIVGLAMYAAYGFGGIKACNSANGFLDNKFVCHIQEKKTFNPYPNLQKFNISLVN